MPRSKITDIARACGTSPASVSRAFRADAPMSGDLRQRILQEAARVGYVPPRRRARDSARVRSFALVVSDLENPFYPLVLNQFSEEAAALGWDMQVFVAPGHGSVDTVRAQVLRADVDAVIVANADLASSLAAECRDRALPVILFNRVQVDARMTAICADNYAGGRLAARRLLDQGLRHIAYVGGRKGTSTHLERRRGLIDALGERQIPLRDDLICDFDYDTAYRAAQGLFARPAPPEGLFCANDQMAFAVIDAAHDAGLQPGRDVAVIGYDDVPMAHWSRYRLTTISQPVPDMVRRTLARLAAHRDMGIPAGEIELVPPVLIPRDSG